MKEIQYWNRKEEKEGLSEDNRKEEMCGGDSILEIDRRRTKAYWRTIIDHRMS